MIKCLSDPREFRLRRERAWLNNTNYWMRGPLRHVQDVGSYIVERTRSLANRAAAIPIIVDMGLGDAWLLRALLQSDQPFEYVGLDVTQSFIDLAREEFRETAGARFERVDFEEENSMRLEADVVVNAFNFFELCNLDTAMANAARLLRTGGTLLVSTIDKTYLMLALSRDWADFFENLRLYERLEGTKYDFQPVDLGSGVSSHLEYPSVLYSADDYINTGARHGLMIRGYKEHAFTAKPVPKIYIHFEFVKMSNED